MPFNCYLCDIAPVYVRFFCDECQKTKRIMAIYGAEECRKILENVCIRDKPKRLLKIKAELKKEIESHGDETYITKKPKKSVV